MASDQNHMYSDFAYEQPRSWQQQQSSPHGFPSQMRRVTEPMYHHSLPSFAGDHKSSIGISAHILPSQPAVSERCPENFALDGLDFLNEYNMPNQTKPIDQSSTLGGSFTSNSFYASSSISTATGTTFPNESNESMLLDVSKSENRWQDDFLGAWEPNPFSPAGSMTSSIAFNANGTWRTPGTPLRSHRGNNARVHPRQGRSNKQRRLNNATKDRVSEEYSSCSGRTSQASAVRPTGPSNKAIAACELWITTNPDTYPPELALFGLSLAFETSIESLREWFGKRLNEPDAEDSGYQTMTTMDYDVALQYQHNLKKCNKKKHRSSGDGPYACTSRCGARFKKKDAWRKHEEINYPQELWCCSLDACQSKPWSKRVRFRKDKFVEHLNKKHGYLNTSPKDLKAYRSQVSSKFDKKCIFRQCSEEFDSWKERIDHLAKHLEEPWDISEWRGESGDEAVAGDDEESMDISSQPSDSDAESEAGGDTSEMEFEDFDDTFHFSHGSDFGGYSSTDGFHPAFERESNHISGGLLSILTPPYTNASTQSRFPKPPLKPIDNLPLSPGSDVTTFGKFTKPPLKPVDPQASLRGSTQPKPDLPSLKRTEVLAGPTMQDVSTGKFSKPPLKPVDPAKGPAAFDPFTGDCITRRA